MRQLVVVLLATAAQCSQLEPERPAMRCAVPNVASTSPPSVLRAARDMQRDELPTVHRQLALLDVLDLRGGETSSWRQWMYKTLSKFGIFLKKGRLLVLGLDNAGKSTLLTVLLRNEVVPTAPTHQPVTDVIKIGHMKLRAVDMGGHEIARRMWAQYSHEADGIVYIVDAVDRERFTEAALELHKLLASPTLPAGAPILILANKVDLPHAAQQEELYYALGLDELAQTGSARPIGLYLCSIFERRGYEEGFEWLSAHI